MVGDAAVGPVHGPVVGEVGDDGVVGLDAEALVDALDGPKHAGLGARADERGRDEAADLRVFPDDGLHHDFLGAAEGLADDGGHGAPIPPALHAASLGRRHLVEREGVPGPVLPRGVGAAEVQPVHGHHHHPEGHTRVVVVHVEDAPRVHEVPGDELVQDRLDDRARALALVDGAVVDVARFPARQHKDFDPVLDWLERHVLLPVDEPGLAQDHGLVDGHVAAHKCTHAHVHTSAGRVVTTSCDTSRPPRTVTTHMYMHAMDRQRQRDGGMAQGGGISTYTPRSQSRWQAAAASSRRGCTFHSLFCLSAVLVGGLL